LFKGDDLISVRRTFARRLAPVDTKNIYPVGERRVQRFIDGLELARASGIPAIERLGRLEVAFPLEGNPKVEGRSDRGCHNAREQRLGRRLIALSTIASA
jgi:hypothetical protein